MDTLPTCNCKAQPSETAQCQVTVNPPVGSGCVDLFIGREEPRLNTKLIETGKNFCMYSI